MRAHPIRRTFTPTKTWHDPKFSTLTTRRVPAQRLWKWTRGLLRLARIEAPRVHDVSQALLDNRELLPEAVRPHVEKLAHHSRTLRRDRELSFHGSDDLTPTDFYREKDASEALAMARETVAVVQGAL